MTPTYRLSILASACLSLGLAAHAQPAKAGQTKPGGAAASVKAPSSAAREAELLRRLEQLAAEVAELKAQVADLRQQAAPAAVAVAPVPAPAPAPAPLAAATPADQGLINGAEPTPAAASATVLGGYGEINYNRYSKDSARNQADVRRVVLGIQHRLDDKTKIVTELEVEHGVTSADDVGEVAIEQAYAERQLNPQWALRAGLFLMPTGLLNENHEPTAYYGVERNFVETAIIPTTWREGGVQFVGNLDHGLTLQAGLSTGFDVSKWETDNAETAESPLGAVHQEMAQAHAKDPAVFAALNWRGLPGLQLGASWFAGNGGQGQTAAAGHGLRVTLWDLHARYTVGGLDLSTLYARGTISGTAAFNTLNIGSGPDWYPIPKRFDGAYVQAAYKLWSGGDLSLSPFTRYERYNTRRAYADLGLGLTPDAQATEQAFTIGANLNVGAGLVFKADIQRFKQNQDNDRFNLGLGWSF